MDNLENVSAHGIIPASRVKDATSAYSIWNTIRVADGPSSIDRAMIDAAYDNEKPYDDAKLQANGQSYRLNVSWGLMDMVLESGMAGYVDIFSAVDSIFECPTKYGMETERPELEQVVAKEVSDCIRSWPDFYWNYLRLCSTFIKHGVSIALFDDETNWRWTATDMSDFKLPRKTKIGQENIGIAGCLRFYSVSDLYNMIKDEDTAREVGYNVEAIKRTIRDTIDNSTSFNSYKGHAWEQLEAELKNNDAFFTSGSADAELARVVHLFVKEFDGKITHIMIDDKQDRDQFLYRKIGRYDNAYQAFIMFVYGVGTNGYYHGVRGQGYKVFSTNGALNIAACQMLENATYGSAVTLQPKDETAMQEMQFMPTGPFNVITPGVQVLKDSVLPNVSQNSIPVLQAFSQMFRDRTSQYNTEALLAANVEKTKYQVQSETSAVSKMSVSSLNLFYVPWELLIKEMVRRMKRKNFREDEPGGQYIVGLINRLKEKGRTGPNDEPDRYVKAFYALDVDRLTVVRAIGSGSEMARMMIFDRLMQMYGTYSDEGKQALVWDMTAASAGFRNASRYATRPGGNRTPMVDVSIAQLENNILMMGGSVEVVDGQNHFAHANVHLKEEEPMLQQVEDAIVKNDIETAAKMLPGVNGLNQHVSKHVEVLSQDPLMKNQAAGMRQILQQADEVLHNGILKVQKAMQNAQQEAMINGEHQQEPQVDPVQLAKMEGERQVRQAKLQWMKETHEQDMDIRRQESAQKMYLKDAETASKIQRTGVRA